MSLGKFDGIDSASIGKFTNLTGVGAVDGVTVDAGDEGVTFLMGAWSTTSPLNQARMGTCGAGSASAAIVFGGSAGSTESGATPLSSTEKWDGDSFQSGGSLNTARLNVMGFGTAVEAFACGGISSGAFQKVVEKWDGTSWTSTTSMPDTSHAQAFVGDTSAAFQCGPVHGYFWNSSSWSTKSGMNNARGWLGACGSTSSCIAGGGMTYLASVEIWNGASWATTSPISEGRNSLCFFGDTSNAVTAGGNTYGYSYSYGVNISEKWNGTSWSLTAPLSNYKYYAAGAGNTSDAIYAGGHSGSVSTPSVAWNEKWHQATTTLSGGVWAVYSVMNKVKYNGGGVGSTSSALVYAGRQSGAMQIENDTESWNGSTWSTAPDLSQTVELIGFFGTTNAAFSVGGWGGDEADHDTTEKFNGVSWSILSSLNEIKDSHSCCGTPSDALCIGGWGDDFYDHTEIWNSSSWATTSALATGPNYGNYSCGTTSSAMAVGGNDGSGSEGWKSDTQIWNGSSWSTTSSLNEAKEYGAIVGNPIKALSFGGDTAGLPVNTTEKWNGSSWSTTTAMLDVLYGLVGAGTPAAAHAMGGTGSQYTEVWGD